MKKIVINGTINAFISRYDEYLRSDEIDGKHIFYSARISPMTAAEKETLYNAIAALIDTAVTFTVVDDINILVPESTAVFYDLQSFISEESSEIETYLTFKKSLS